MDFSFPLIQLEGDLSLFYFCFFLYACPNPGVHLIPPFCFLTFPFVTTEWLSSRLDGGALYKYWVWPLIVYLTSALFGFIWVNLSLVPVQNAEPRLTKQGNVWFQFCFDHVAFRGISAGLISPFWKILELNAASS